MRVEIPTVFFHGTNTFVRSHKYIVGICRKALEVVKDLTSALDEVSLHIF